MWGKQKVRGAVGVWNPPVLMPYVQSGEKRGSAAAESRRWCWCCWCWGPKDAVDVGTLLLGLASLPRRCCCWLLLIGCCARRCWKGWGCSGWKLKWCPSPNTASTAERSERGLPAERLLWKGFRALNGARCWRHIFGAQGPSSAGCRSPSIPGQAAVEKRAGVTDSWWAADPVVTVWLGFPVRVKGGPRYWQGAAPIPSRGRRQSDSSRGKCRRDFSSRRTTGRCSLTETQQWWMERKK